MEKITRKLPLILLLALLGAPAWQAVSAENGAGDDQTPAGDQAVRPAPPRVTEVLDRAAESTDDSSRKEAIVFGKDVVVREGEVYRQVVVISGNATIDGTVDGDVVVVGGSAKITGKINGGLVVVLGSATLGPDAQVKRDAVVVGGPLVTEPGARIEGGRQEIGIGAGWTHFNPLVGWIGKGLLHARLLPPSRGWWWIAAFAFLFVYVLTALLFPRPMQACVRALETRPVASIFSGILAFLLIGPVMLLLAVSGVGLAVLPFLFCAMIAVSILGKVTVYQCTGLQLGRQTGLSSLQLPLVALVIGIVIFFLLYTIPILSLVVWGLIAPLGVGAVLMAFFGAFRKEGKTNGTPAPTDRTATVPPASASSLAANPPLTNLAVDANPSAPLDAGVPPVLPASPSASVPPPPLASAPPAIFAPPVSADTLLLPRVGFWLRLLAVILDALLIGGITKLLHLHHMFLPLWIAYHIGMWTWRGTTIGGVVMGIKILRQDGHPLNFGVALVRLLASFFSFMVLCLGFFWAGWDKEKQSWHDKIAGTIVVRMPKGISLL
ncbi:MAG: RDD family protein [Limisphaerales bacterium]